MKLRTKVILVNVTIMTVTLFTCGYFILNAVDNLNLYSAFQNLKGQSSFCEQYMSEYLKGAVDQKAALQRQKSSLENLFQKNIDSRVEIKVIGDNKATPIQKSAFNGDKTYLISTKGDIRMLYISEPVYGGDTVIGSINFEKSLYQADSIKRNLVYILFIISFIALIVLFVLSYIFSYYLINPLEKLMHAAKEFSKGNFKLIDDINTGDEVEQLAQEFNKMGQDIDKIISDLREEQKKQKKFLDNVTHEIRTPLANIMGYADFIRRSDKSSDQDKYVEIIHLEGSRMISLVNNLLDLSRLNTYNQAIIRSQSNLKELLEQVVALMTDRTRKYGFTIDTMFEDISASIDSDKIKQVVINLIENVIKHSEGNQINIRLWKDDMIYLQINDNGIGIPPEDIEYVLEPFYRVDKARSRKKGCSGLGLSICREIMAAHGGEIRIESKVDRGTTVTLLLQQ